MQKTAYEERISDWSSDVCSSDLEIIHERAVITGPNAVKLASGRTVTARYILVAVGAWPVVPECEGNELGITSNEVFHLETLPKRVVIAGGGYIANEFAGIFHERSEEHTSELPSLMRISYAVFCLKKKKSIQLISTHMKTNT